MSDYSEVLEESSEMREGGTDGDMGGHGYPPVAARISVSKGQRVFVRRRADCPRRFHSLQK